MFMAAIQGLIDHIIYHNEANGYTVLSLLHAGDEIVCTGTMPVVNEGEYIRAEGDYVDHASYGRQFKITGFSVEAPEDLFSIERYLASGAIKGIGPSLAGRIVKKFKEETFRIIEQEPERLSEVKGISEKKAQEIYVQFHDKQDMRQAMMFLSKYGITTAYAVKIYNQYGSRLYDIIRENPYKLAEDVGGIGFKLADEIAKKAGISESADFRIHSGVVYTLTQMGSMGHTCLPVTQLIQTASSMLEVETELIERQLMTLATEKKIVIKKIDEVQMVYAASYYYMELSVAERLKNLDMKTDIVYAQAEKTVKSIEKKAHMDLDEMQRDAVYEAMRNGVLVITGGPGTGKTTTINTMIKVFQQEGLEIRLAAPTGRAAKRMSEATGCEAQTIHRVLELTGAAEDSTGRMTGMHFERNEQNPLETDVIIIDEMSMVDIFLMNALLKAIVPGTRLIMVGDVNQLPSVGPGNVLRDIIDSEMFQVVRLTKIFRQALESAIITNAHKINSGILPDLSVKTTDFFSLPRNQVTDIQGVVIALVRDLLPKNLNIDPADVQVLTPMRKGELGVERLNKLLQTYLNPADGTKNEKEQGERIFREGDKVMQIKNNYQLEWEITDKYGIALEKGIGVFNGDTGIIREINPYAEQLTVEYDEGRQITYAYAQLDELELAYAMTIHKAQGSEYLAIVLPLLEGPRMLFNRNILYTAVTRAKNCVAIVGSEKTVETMVNNERQQKRYSGLKWWLSQ